MKTILCPTDFSQHSENAIKYAIEINKQLQAKIILMHAFETPLLFSDVVTLTAQYDYKMIHDAAVKRLKAFHKKLFGENIREALKSDMILKQGLASARICEIAAEIKADLIVMGTTGTSAAERLFLGSNASRVLKNAPCMVMLIPSKAKYEGLAKIVYATDLQEDNLRHVNEIIPFAKTFNSELLFLYVNNSSVEQETFDLNKATEKIKTIVSYPKQSGYICTDNSVSDGINYFLQQHRPGCIAVYTHQRNLLQRFYQPSISKKLSQHVFIPLLVLHEKDYALPDI